jgi:hypothetical protein
VSIVTNPGVVRDLERPQVRRPPMTTRRPEFVSRTTQRALRSLASEIDVKAIEGLWRDQGFVPVSELHYEDSSLRRTTFESSSAAVDWTDVAQVERACRRRVKTDHLAAVEF